MIAYYGYENGSGEYYISIDTAKCNSCGDCIKKCPKDILEMTTMMIELEDKSVASVKEKHRKEIKYICNACEHNDKAPCVGSCKQKAIGIIWGTR